MPKMRIKVEHHIKQVVILDVTKDELANMTYEDAIVNAPFDEFQSFDSYSDIIDVTVDGAEHYF